MLTTWSGFVSDTMSLGLNRICHTKEEGELANLLMKCAEIGYTKTKDEVIGIVRKALLMKRGVEFVKEFKGKGWLARFGQSVPSVGVTH